jgi:ankyrin repeat protein
MTKEDSFMVMVLENCLDRFSFCKTLRFILSIPTRFRIRLNPNAQFGPKGTTLLHTAALMGESKLVAAFGHCKFEHGLIDFQDRDGNTALHIAALKNYHQVSLRFINS